MERDKETTYAIGCVAIMSGAVLTAACIVLIGWLFGLGLRLSGL